MQAEITHSAADFEALVQFLYLAPVGLIQITRTGEIVMINPVSAQLLLPLAPQGDLSNLFTALGRVAPDLKYQVDHFDRPHGMICEALRFPVGPSGKRRAEVQVLSITMLKLDAERLMIVLSDVTEQVRRERLLKQNEAWLNAILVGIADYAILTLDRDGRVDDWNPSIGRVTGFGREAVVDKSFALFCPEEGTTPDRLDDLLREADENGWSLDEGWRVRADGTRFWGSSLISPLAHRRQDPPERGESQADDEPSGYCLVIRDISDKREANEDLRRSMFCDHLTGLANRRAFFEAAELEWARAKRSPRSLSLLLFDADHLLPVNDNFGHTAGDALLRHVAKVCGATFREVDMVARVGGDEFAVLLPSTGAASALSAAERLRRAIEARPVMVDERAVHLTVSGGVACTEDGSMSFERLMTRADAALSDAKAAGGNRIVCAGSLTDG